MFLLILTGTLVVGTVPVTYLVQVFVKVIMRSSVHLLFSVIYQFSGVLSY